MHQIYLKLSFFISIVFLAWSCARPIANFSVVGPATLIAPGKIELNNTSKNANAYTWSFGTGDSSLLVSPSYRYSASGRYLIQLTASKGKKSATTIKEVIVKAPTECLVLMTTTEGEMLMKLYPETPTHRDNFLKLCEEGYYEGLLFHRVMQNFMIQGGDPDSRGASAGQRLGVGGPGYTISPEIIPGLYHKKGALAAARLGDQVNPLKNSSGSQFYIVHGQPVTENSLNVNIDYTEKEKAIYFDSGGAPQLDGLYTVFGEVIEGLDIIDKITKIPTDGSDRPTTDVKIISIEIIK